MATRPQGTKYAKGSGAATVMTGIGNLYSLFLSWRGVTAGDRFVVTDGNGGAGIEEVIFAEANNSGLNIIMPTVGKEFANGLYVTPIVAGGEVNWSVGYDGNG